MVKVDPAICGVSIKGDRGRRYWELLRSGGSEAGAGSPPRSFYQNQQPREV